MNALAARKDEIEKVKIASNLMIWPYAFLGGDYVGKITYYSGYCGPLERMFMSQGNVVPFPMHLSKAYKALEPVQGPRCGHDRSDPPDERGYMNYGPCGVVYGRYSTTKCKKVIAQVNAKTPWIHGIENMIHVSEIDYIVEKDHDLPGVPEIEITEVEKKIGE
ncbi:MAG: hypothetical protein MZU91_03440 [Desulfosudis oleivorans]|nr:hypothetical protein [Desulfosudis oleivorans]